MTLVKELPCYNVYSPKPESPDKDSQRSKRERGHLDDGENGAERNASVKSVLRGIIPRVISWVSRQRLCLRQPGSRVPLDKLRD